ncbi:hypothetical protein KP509_08G013800 [Ceratopteris richardii]|nr:hypothetical protein KP509_08G013800 [Ceratopteris richardii]
MEADPMRGAREFTLCLSAKEKAQRSVDLGTIWSHALCGCV